MQYIKRSRFLKKLCYDLFCTMHYLNIYQCHVSMNSMQQRSIQVLQIVFNITHFNHVKSTISPHCIWRLIYKEIYTYLTFTIFFVVCECFTVLAHLYFVRCSPLVVCRTVSTLCLELANPWHVVESNLHSIILKILIYFYDTQFTFATSNSTKWKIMWTISAKNI